MVERLQLTTNQVMQIEPVFRKGWEEVHAIQDRSIKEVEAAVALVAKYFPHRRKMRNTMGHFSDVGSAVANREQNSISGALRPTQCSPRSI